MKKKYTHNISTITTINRGDIGEKVLDQLAHVKDDGSILKTFWLGLEDGSIISDTCPQFLEE